MKRSSHPEGHESESSGSEVQYGGTDFAQQSGSDDERFLGWRIEQAGQGSKAPNQATQVRRRRASTPVTEDDSSEQAQSVPSKEAWARQQQTQQSGAQPAKRAASSQAQKPAAASGRASSQAPKPAAASGGGRSGVKDKKKAEWDAIVKEMLPLCTRTTREFFRQFGMTETTRKEILRLWASSRAKHQDTPAAKVTEAREPTSNPFKELKTSETRHAPAAQAAPSGEKGQEMASLAGAAAEERRRAESQRGVRNKEQRVGPPKDPKVSRDTQVLLCEDGMEAAFLNCLRTFNNETQINVEASIEHQRQQTEEDIEDGPVFAPSFYAELELDTDFYRFVMNQPSAYEVPPQWQTYDGFLTCDKKTIEEHYISYAFPVDFQSSFADDKVVMKKQDVCMVLYRPVFAARAQNMIKFVLKFIGIDFHTDVDPNIAPQGYFQLRDRKKFERIFPKNHWVMRLTRILRFTKLLFPGTAYQFYAFLVEHAVKEAPEEPLATPETQKHWKRVVFTASPFSV